MSQTEPQTGTHNVVTPPRARAADRKVYGKSKVTNGGEFLPGVVDGRSLIARRYRDIASAIMVDQGDSISEARAQLVRRFSAAAVLAEQLEARLANGETIDIAEHALLTSKMVRVANKIGIDRIAKNINGPSLGELIQQDQAAERQRLAQEREQQTEVAA